MDNETREVLEGAQVEALPEFVGMVIEAGAGDLAEILNVAKSLEDSAPDRTIAILKGLARHASPDERFVDALLSVGAAQHSGFGLADAREQIEIALQRAGAAEPALRERVVTNLVSTHALPEAVAFAAQSVGRSLTPRFWYIALRLAEKLEDEATILSAARELSKCALDDPGQVATAGAVLLRFGQAQDVVEMIDRVPGATSNADLMRLRLDAETRLGRSDELSLAKLRMAAAENPADVRIADLEAQLLIGMNRPEEAVQAYARVPHERLNHTMRLRLGKAHELSRDLDSAIDIYMQVLRDAPNNAALRRRLVGLCDRAGRSSDARELYREGTSKWANTLDRDVYDNLSTILQADNSNAIPSARALWFASALTEAGYPPPADWRARAGDMARIDNFIVEYAQAFPDGVQALTQLAEVTPEAREKLDAALELGKGAFIASAHVGLLYAGPIVLNKKGGRFAYVASVPDLGQDGVSTGLISTSTNDLSSVARRIIRALRENATVAIAIDGAGIVSEVRRSLFGKDILLSDFTPRLAWRSGTPSFFPRITMEDNIARFRLETMPMPEPDESEDAYAARWLDAYVASLTRFLCEHPEAMRGTGGLWKHVNTV